MIGEIILNYKIIRKIGEGRLGIVYLAEHQKIKNKLVAIKVFTPLLATNINLKSSFIQEAELLAKLNHPNIASLIDFVDQDDKLMIVMEYVQGYPLDIYIEKNGSILEERAVNIYLKVLDAFKYAHNVGVINGDVKPSNIILTENDNPKIIDFGIAKVIRDSGSDKGISAGTVIYMSPEHVSGAQIDLRSDIYSLGVNLFFILSGRKPYDVNLSSEFIIQEKIKKEPLPSLKNIVPSITDGLESIIFKATEKNPNNRFQNCEEFIDALKNFKTYSSSSTFRSFASMYSNDSTSFDEKKTVPLTSGTDYTNIQYQQQSQTPYPDMHGYPYPKTKKSVSIGVIIASIAVIVFIIAGVLIFSIINSSDSENSKDNDYPKKVENTDGYNTDEDNKIKPKLYFCETYDTEKGEIGVSNKFTTGYLTVMVDYRTSKQKIGLKDVYIRIAKIKDEFGLEIKERIIKTIPFTVDPEWDYIYFFDRENINFKSPGTYKVYLLDKNYKYITHGVVEIVR